MYKYSKLDARKDKSFYMYSKFEGIKFLNTYKENRLDSIKLINNKIDTCKNIKKLEDDYEATKILTAPSEKEINTQETLKSCVSSICKKNSQKTLSFNWCDVFAKKFEISRKLACRYGKNLKSIDKNETGIDSYAYLARLICYFIENRGLNLRYLNALLKANDLSICNIRNIDNTRTLTILKESIEKELSYIKKLMLKTGLL